MNDLSQSEYSYSSFPNNLKNERFGCIRTYKSIQIIENNGHSIGLV